MHTSLSPTLSLSLTLGGQCFIDFVLIVLVLYVIYLGQGPLPLDVLQPSQVIRVLPVGARDPQDWLDHLNSLGYRLTTRLTLVLVVLPFTSGSLLDFA